MTPYDNIDIFDKHKKMTLTFTWETYRYVAPLNKKCEKYKQ